MCCSHWLNFDQSVAPPALLCHEEPAQDTQRPLLEAYLALSWFFMAQEGWQNNSLNETSIFEKTGEIFLFGATLSVVLVVT